MNDFLSFFSLAYFNMDINKKGCGIKITNFVALIVFLLHEEVALARKLGSGLKEFDVTTFGAKGDGEPEYNDYDGQSMIGLEFIEAWRKACNSFGPSKVVIPKGSFAVAQVLFAGPCQSRVTVELEGNIIPDPDRSQFPNNQLLVFQQVDGATLTGAGIIDVNLPKTPDDPEKEIVYMDIMPSISLLNVTNFVIDGIHSKNPWAFDVLVDGSHNVSIVNSNFEANDVTPNTHSNAIYISSSSLVSIENTYIKTGDDCITISGGSNDISVGGVTCVDGQGISIGSQPISSPEATIQGVKVKNCTFKGVSYGARINPRPHQTPGQVSNIIFEDLVMDQAKNPIYVNQEFPTKPDKPNYAKITDVHFKNIRGTTTTNTAISISCVQESLCDAIEVANVDLSFSGKETGGLTANCKNAQATLDGKHLTPNMIL